MTFLDAVKAVSHHNECRRLSRESGQPMHAEWRECDCDRDARIAAGIVEAVTCSRHAFLTDTDAIAAFLRVATR